MNLRPEKKGFNLLSTEGPDSARAGRIAVYLLLAGLTSAINMGFDFEACGFWAIPLVFLAGIPIQMKAWGCD